MKISTRNEIENMLLPYKIKKFKVLEKVMSEPEKNTARQIYMIYIINLGRKRIYNHLQKVKHK